MKKIPTKRDSVRPATPGPALGKRTAALMRKLETMPGATAHPMSNPSGSAPSFVIYKVMAKMFAILSIRGVENVILKCDPDLADVLRGKYTGVGHRSHLDRRYWISVVLDADVPAAEVARLAGLSYQLVCSGLTRKQQADLAAMSADPPLRQSARAPSGRTR